MQIILNDNVESVHDNQTLHDILVKHVRNNNTYAVSVNHAFVPKHEHHYIVIREGDVIDIIVPMQGG